MIQGSEVGDTRRDIIEEYIRYASKHAPGWEEAHALIASMVVSHAIRDARIPWTRPQIFLMLVAPPGKGKKFVIDLAVSSIIPRGWASRVRDIRPIDMVSTLTRSDLNATPILIVEEFGYCLTSDYTAVHSFVLSAYCGEAWRYRSKAGTIVVPSEYMRLSMLVSMSPHILSGLMPRRGKASRFKHMATDIVSRMLITSGSLDLRRASDFVPESDLSSAVALLRRSRVSHARFEFDSSNTKNEILSYAEDAKRKHEGLIGMVFSRIHEHIVKLAAAYSASKHTTIIGPESAEFAIGMISRILPDILSVADATIRFVKGVEKAKDLRTKIRKILKRSTGPMNLRDLYRRLGITKEEILDTLKSIYGSSIRLIVDGRSTLVCDKAGTEYCARCPYKLKCYIQYHLRKMDEETS